MANSSTANVLIGAGLDMVAVKAKIAAAKKGKTKEQKACIDFFASDYNLGCGGCLSSARVMSMEEYQKRVGARSASLDLRNRAIAKVGLDESEISEIAPICLSAYVFDDLFWTKAENGVAVSSQFCVTWLFFSSTQMYVYSYTFDMISDNTVEETHDFFYQDITCFKTINKLVEKIVNEEKSCLKNPKGCLGLGDSTYKQNYIVDILEITVPGKSYAVWMRDAGSQTQSIQAAKAMLRERKFLK